MSKFRHFLVCLMLIGAFFSSCKKEDSISVSIPLLEVDYVGEDFSVDVQSTAPWTVVANYARTQESNHQDPVWYTSHPAPYSTETGWITFDITKGEAGVTHITVHVDATANYSRKGSAIFQLEKGGLPLVLPVYQQGKLDKDLSEELSPEMIRFVGTSNFKEILNMKRLDLRGQTFDFEKDLVYFENLHELYCSDCGLTSFTTKIPSLQRLEINGNQLTRLDLELFPNLEYLDCSDNPLESLDILEAPKLRQVSCSNVPFKEISVGSSVEWIICRDCGLERLDLSQALGLQEVICTGNKLAVLDFSQTSMERLECSDNPSLTSLVFPKGDVMKALSASNCGLSGQLTISSGQYYWIDLSGNKLDKLTVTGTASVDDLTCRDNLLTEITLPENHHTSVHCENNLLSQLGPVRLNWRSRIDGNPGRDGVFTLYVKESEREYFTNEYYIPSPWQWQWRGQTITADIVLVP